MKITNVEVFILQTNIEPLGFSQWWHDRRTANIVKISTSEGVTGWGECHGPGEGHKAVIEKLFAPLLVGEDPTDIGVLWESLYNRFRDYGQKGLVIASLSGIDIALWDILGKTLNRPIGKLIGGIRRERIKAYAAGLYFRNPEAVPRARAEEAERYAKAGFTAVKMKIGQGEKTDVASVRSVREAIGPDTLLMVDANHAYNSTRALGMARQIEAQDIYWFEDPVPPEDVDGYLEVKMRSSIPVAGGEAEFTRYGFRELVSRRAVDFIQPNVCSTGGISEVCKIAVLASTFNIQIMPHTWGSSIALAASLHLLSALPDCPPSLDPVEPMLELDRADNPFRTHLSRQPIEQKDGYVTVPTGPGLGIDIDEKIIVHYRVA